MKEVLKKILKSAGIYHPLQSAYRELLTWLQRNIYRVRYRKFKGKGFTCIVCKSQYSEFGDDHPAKENQYAISKFNVIAGYGKNIICPYCLSTARERLVIAILSQFDLQGKEILHLSPEKNVYHLISEQADVITSDITPGFYKTIDRSILWQDATKLTFRDNCFNMVIANHVLEHIPDDKQALKEIFRVLKPGGSAILQVPYSESINETFENSDITDPHVRSAMFGQNDHVRIYSLADYVQRLKNTGFTVRILSYDQLKHLYKYAIQKDECFLEIIKPSTS